VTPALLQMLQSLWRGEEDNAKLTIQFSSSFLCMISTSAGSQTLPLPDKPPRFAPFCKNWHVDKISCRICMCVLDPSPYQIFHTSSNGVSAVVIKSKAEHRPVFRTAAMLLYVHLTKGRNNKSCIFSEHLLQHKLSGLCIKWHWCRSPPRKFARPPCFFLW
jgi:hypothetical protein